MSNEEAYITLATNDTYAVGALVLAASLRQVQTAKKLCILVTPDVSNSMKALLGNAFDEVVNVNVLDSEDAAHLALMSRPELGITFTKIHCWTQTQYSKAVFLDADTLVIKNCDELFEHDELSAVTDVGWPDIFNSGVFVFKPDNNTFQALLRMAVDRGSFDGGDQGLLNQYFSKWTRLSFIYNMVSAIAYTYLPAYKQYGKETKIVHFLGARKPWEADIDEKNGMPTNVSPQDAGAEHLMQWWTLFLQNVQPHLQGNDLRGFAARFAHMSLSDVVQMRRWEGGQPEYMGRDSFEHIQRKIALSIKKSETDAPSSSSSGGGGGGSGAVQQPRGKDARAQQQQSEQQQQQRKSPSPPTRAGTGHLQHEQPTQQQQQQQHSQQQHGQQHGQQQQQQQQQQSSAHHQQQQHQPQEKVVVRQEVHKEELFQQAKAKSPVPLSKEELQQQQIKQQQHSPPHGQQQQQHGQHGQQHAQQHTQQHGQQHGQQQHHGQQHVVVKQEEHHYTETKTKGEHQQEVTGQAQAKAGSQQQQHTQQQQAASKPSQSVPHGQQQQQQQQQQHKGGKSGK